MWTLTSDNLERAKVELDERRAAAEARYAAELKAIDTDLEEIETLARFAHSFSMKHPSEAGAAPESGETNPPVGTEPEGDAAIAQLEAEPAKPHSPASETTEAPSAAPTADPPAALPNTRKEPSPSTDGAPKGGSSRWRIRIPTDNEMANSGV